jgi:hypothetical protein
MNGFNNRQRSSWMLEGLTMKSASRMREPAVVTAPQNLSGMLRSWAQSLYEKAHDPSHCARCGVYLPAQNRICDPCARED